MVWSVSGGASGSMSMIWYFVFHRYEGSRAEQTERSKLHE